MTRSGEWSTSGRLVPIGRSQGVVLLVTACATALASPAVRALLTEHGVLDVPNHRSSHAHPVPRGGGIACFVGLLGGAAAASALRQPVPKGALLGSSVLALVGLIDDRRSLPPEPRLAAQAVVGAAFGLRRPYPLGGTVLGFGVMPASVNVVNFMDGINGITCLTMAVFGAAALDSSRRHGQGALGTLGAMTAGAALGFLPSNAPRAKMFLGDIGSYLFGGLAGSGLLIASRGGWRVAAPLASALSVYFADTAWTLARRALRGEDVTAAHREHVYQRLVAEHGWSHSRAALFAAACAAGASVAWSLLGPRSAAVATSCLVGTYLGMPRIVRWASERSRKSRFSICRKR